MKTSGLIPLFAKVSRNHFLFILSNLLMDVKRKLGDSAQKVQNSNLEIVNSNDQLVD